jgi:hypothetical protein|tara:strand:- start:411 stop:647 length:237 start_codon:yes stop_codon:yes gene_type:complete
MKQTQRTSEGLCEALFQEFDMLRNGQSDYQRAAAVAKLAVQIISTKRLEIEAAQFEKLGLKFKSLALSSKGVEIGSYR